MYVFTYTTKSAHVDVVTMMVFLRESLYCNMGISNHPYIHDLRESGALQHRPRGPGPVEPRLPAENVRYSPTKSSRCALETLIAKARLGLVGGLAGSVTAAAARSVERSGRCRRHKCL